MTRLAAIRKPFGILARSLEIRTTAVSSQRSWRCMAALRFCIADRPPPPPKMPSPSRWPASSRSRGRPCCGGHPPSARPKRRPSPPPFREIGWSGAPTAQARTDPALRPLLERLKALDPGLGRVSPSPSTRMRIPSSRKRPRRYARTGGCQRAHLPLRHAPGVSDSVPWSVLATTMPVSVGIAAVLLIHGSPGPCATGRFPQPQHRGNRPRADDRPARDRGRRRPHRPRRPRGGRPPGSDRPAARGLTWPPRRRARDTLRHDPGNRTTWDAVISCLDAAAGAAHRQDEPMTRPR